MVGDAPPRASAWARAAELAARTPPQRNRTVDLLRAGSIGVVVLGHWLMAAVYVADGELAASDMLKQAPWTQWLTWAFQVMPLFFFVGGYANAASWDAARRRGSGYPAWIGSRLRRLVGPIVPLVLFWAALAAAAARAGVEPATVRLASQAALIPTWFLAVYVGVVIVVPPTHWLWRRFGSASFLGLAAGAAAVDALAFGLDWPLVRWANYAFVWLGVHQLGYLWRAGRLSGARPLLYAAAGGALLAGLVFGAGYPVSMITVPGEELSNSRPPTLALLALGMLHAGLALSVEARLRRWLERPWLWTATVLVNGTIMTVYLWHVTAMVLVATALNLAGGIGLGLQPGTGAWWATRPLWIAVLLAALVPFIAAFGRFEQAARRGAESLSTPRAVCGAAAVCAGLAVLALNGIGSPGPLGFRLDGTGLVLVGAALILLGSERAARSVVA